MKKNVVTRWGLLLVGLLLAAGCAKQEVVKKDAQGAAAATPASAGSTTTPAAPPVAVPDKNGNGNNGQANAAGNQAGASNQAAASLAVVYFEFDSATLSPASRDILTGVAGKLKATPARKLRIEGHCDERGSDEYNLALGEKRAKAALAYLVGLGVDAGRLATISYGEEKPADPGHDEAAWAKNRRDELVPLD